jgi:tetratricopeptide (TPR) repeat protein
MQRFITMKLKRQLTKLPLPPCIPANKRCLSTILTQQIQEQSTPSTQFKPVSTHVDGHRVGAIGISPSSQQVNVVESLVDMNRKAIQMCQAGDKHEAKKTFRKVRDMVETLLGDRQMNDAEVLRIADVCCSLGLFYKQNNKWQKAERMLKRAINLRNKVLGEDHTSVGNALAWLGMLYKKQGSVQEAIQHLDQALQVLVNGQGHFNLPVAVTSHHLGMLHFGAQNLDDAEVFLRRASTIFTLHNGLHHGYSQWWEGLMGPEWKLPLTPEDVVASLNSLASIYWQKGMLKHAAREYRQLLFLLRHGGVKTSPVDEGQVLVCLACVHEGQQNLVLAVDYLERALKYYARVGDTSQVSRLKEMMTSMFKKDVIEGI